MVEQQVSIGGLSDEAGDVLRFIIRNIQEIINSGFKF